MRKQIRKIKLEKIFLFLPIIIGFVYIFFLSEKKYESNAKILIQKITEQGGVKSPLSSLMIGSVSNEVQDSYTFENYLKSFNVFKKIDDKYKIKDIYSSKETDILERLNKNSFIEDYYALYIKNLKFEFDEKSNIITLYFSTHDPILSKNILDELLVIGEEYLNRINNKNAEIEKEFIQNQIITNENKIKDLEDSIKTFQKTNKIVDPELNLKMNQTILLELTKEKNKKQSILNIKKTYLSDVSPESQILTEEINEINKSIKEIEDKLYSNNKSLNELFFDFEHLKSRLKLELSIHKETLISFEMSKLDSLKKSKKLEIISEPFVAEKEIYPNKITMFLSIIIITIMLFYILKFIKAIIKEHKE